MPSKYPHTKPLLRMRIYLLAMTRMNRLVLRRNLISRLLSNKTLLRKLRSLQALQTMCPRTLLFLTVSHSLTPISQPPSFPLSISSQLPIIDYKKYNYELIWAVVFIVSIVVFFYGRSANDSLAQSWKRACSEVISNNFAHFGVTKETSTSLE